MRNDIINNNFNNDNNNDSNDNISNLIDTYNELKTNGASDERIRKERIDIFKTIRK